MHRAIYEFVIDYVSIEEFTSNPGRLNENRQLKLRLSGEQFKALLEELRESSETIEKQEELNKECFEASLLRI